ncbi:MAG: thiamine diphosphokinase [Legionellales bacterium]|nr:thiamine diphosphokinase [Legionellales bacterium]|tara:strand:+ start:17591 stop:18235 length:645 start_codon:yes stop_codon:yes gene_type:complete
MRAIIIANGDCDNPKQLAALFRADDFVIAVDGGARHCETLSAYPDLLIGDFDSLDKPILKHFVADDVKMLCYPRHKDQIDLELAVDHAIAEGATEIAIITAMGGRWDMTLANLFLLTQEKYAMFELYLTDTVQRGQVIRAGSAVTLTVKAGGRFSLIPLLGDATGISANDLEYPLANHTLSLGSTKGLSNRTLADAITIELQQGLVYACYEIGD